MIRSQRPFRRSVRSPPIASVNPKLAGSEGKVISESYDHRSNELHHFELATRFRHSAGMLISKIVRDPELATRTKIL